MISETTQARLEALRDRVEHFRSRSGRWLILTHDNPDPDSLISATILAKVLRQHLGQRVTVAYGGIIGRAENQAMVRHLKLKLSQRRHIQLKRYRHFALVDCQPGTGNSQLPDDVEADLVIDHHPLRKGTRSAAVVDVRTDYGATASIVAEYLLAAGLEPTRKEASGIVYAIRSETLDFSRESPGPDRQLYDHFLGLADKRALGKIQNPRLPLEYFVNLHQALENLEAVDSLVVSHLGPIAQPDIVPEVADLLLRLEGKTWSMCTGVFDQRVYLSIRTSNPRAQAEKLMRRILGRKGKGGGHGMIAGGWTPAETPEEADKMQRHLARRLAKVLRKNPDRLAPLVLTPKPENGAAQNGGPKEGADQG